MKRVDDSSLYFQVFKSCEQNIRLIFFSSSKFCVFILLFSFVIGHIIRDPCFVLTMKVFAHEYLCVLGELFQKARFVGMCDEFALGVTHIKLRFRVYFFRSLSS